MPTACRRGQYWRAIVSLTIATLRALRHVVLRERAAVDDRYADGGEVVGADVTVSSGVASLSVAWCPLTSTPSMLMSGASGSRDAVETAVTPGSARERRNARSRNAAARAAVVAVHLQVERQRRHRRRIEAEIRRPRREQAAAEQRAGDEQHQRERELADDQHVAERDPAPAGGAAPRP